MLINPYLAENRDVVATIPGTRIVVDPLEVTGAKLHDPANSRRVWTVTALYAPVRGRVVGGLRAKLVDNKGFFTFCNQRDLELLLGYAEPGDYCSWLGDDYVDTTDRRWIGFGVDSDDMLDDLYERELELRAQYADGVPLPTNMSFERRVHDGAGNDYIELMLLMWDGDPDTGYSPDTRFETVERRWTSVEKSPTHIRGRLWATL